MKTITLMDSVHNIKSEYDQGVCVWETRASNLENYDDTVINLGQKVFNIKILETDSIVFSLSPNDTVLYVTMFPQMFGFPIEDQMNEINKLNDLISKSQDKINDIYDNIQRAGYSEIKL